MFEFTVVGCWLLVDVCVAVCLLLDMFGLL